MSAYKTNLLKEWKSVETHLDFSEWVITRLEEEEQRNELFGDCLRRGLKLWQEANPDKDYWISGDENIKWMLDQIAALRERVAVETAKKELLEKLVKIVYEKLKKDIEPVSGVGCEWELGVMESIDAYFEMPAPKGE